MKKFIASSVTAATLLFGQAAYADDISDLQKQLQEMKDQLQQQQEQINQLEGQAGQQFVTRDEARRLIQNEMTVMVDERIEQGMAQMRDSSPILTLGPNIDGLDIRGDLTFRFVRVETDADYVDADPGPDGPVVGNGGTGTLDNSEDAFGVRLSLGGVWSSEGWEIGVGFTLNSNGGSSFDGVNGNVFNTYGDTGVFGSDNIDLDYAYAAHTWGNLTLTVGQQINPFHSSWILWDGDIRPIGVTGEYVYQDFFLTGGVYDVNHYGVDEAEGYLFAAQTGINTTYDQLDIVAAVAWYHFNQQVTDSNDGADPIEGFFTGLEEDYQYNLLDLYVDLSYNFQDEFTIGLTGQYVHNFGAEGSYTNSQIGSLSPSEEPEDNNVAWLIGGSLTWRAWTASYAYAHIEADALPGTLSDDEFGSSLSVGYNSVNTEGHRIGLSYAVNENITITGTAFLVESIEDFNSGLNDFGDGSGTYRDEEGRRYQIDVMYIF
jgi:hypothetical protein